MEINIREFYQGKVVFLTGASGFLGRMTLEKLLRACDVKRIYILLRAKQNKNTEKRIDELFDSIVFENVSKINPNYKEKITIVEGDCSLPDLDLKPEIKLILMQEVEIIMHWAATVKFDENLKIATNINVRAVRDLMKMAKQMPLLKSFLHCSTAYSHCEQEEIGEEFYSTPITGEGLIATMEALNAETVFKITPILLDKWANSYVFTKAVTENMIQEHGQDMPIGILRPSMVLATYKEPVPGWIDNVYGPTGTMIGMAMGFIRVMKTDLSCTAEVVPGDVVVNMAIAAVVDIHQRGTLDIKEIPIYNCVSSVQSPITWQKYKLLTEKHGRQIPSPKIVWHSIRFFTGNTIVYYLAIFFLHLIPAYIVDGVARIIGRKPLMVKAYKKIHHIISMVAYFALHSWRYKNNNAQQLWHQLSGKDKALFIFSMENFDWDDYFKYYTRGGRIYLLKDSMDTIDKGRKKMKMLKMAHYALCGCLLFIFYKMFCLVLLAIKQS